MPDESWVLCEGFGSGMIDSVELAYAAASLAASTPVDGDLIVEIGTFEGSTAAFLAKTLELMGVRASVLSIDPFERFETYEGNPQGSYARYLATLQTHAVERCFPLVAFSWECADAVRDDLAFLLIDGDHAYESCRRDLEMYCTKLRRGGHVLIDDYNPDSYPGVVRAVDEFFDSSPGFELVHLAWFAVGRRVGSPR